MAQTLLAHDMASRSSQANLRQLMEAYERRLIVDALVRARGNQRRAAAELGCLPTTLNEKMRRMGLRARDRQGYESGVSEAELVGHA